MQNTCASKESKHFFYMKNKPPKKYLVGKKEKNGNKLHANAERT